MRPATLLLLLAATLPAQWLTVPTPGVPRNADGSPNLAAPAPRTGGHPDFSGMWVPRDEFPCDPARNGNVQCLELPLAPQVLNFAQELKDGLPYQPWAAQKVKDRAKEAAFTDPHVFCMPPNYPRAWALPETQKIFQTPTQLVVLHEFNASYRQIFFDGRALPEVTIPAWSGYSAGRWDGDTLVVESTGYRDDSWLDTNGNFFTDEAKVTERITRPTWGTLEVEVTVNDPKAFTKPWTVHLHLKPLLGTEMIDLMCVDNNKDLSHFVH